ncbi:MAG TPA: arsenic resistance N-acetyltransferase ArsN2 [Patescibacteria group bacterium]|nr:arsenic resistance N-acetyltransferase ArsN2 [Patescibacteria group bacterium]
MEEVFKLRPARSGDLEAVTDLLEGCGLHIEGIEEHVAGGYVVAEHEEEIIGVCGIETYGTFGLMRSLAVSRSWRGRSVGRRLFEDRTAWARAEGIRALYLLTIDADGYCECFGFSRILRDDVPDEIRGSLEFSSLCPVTAVVMVKSLGDDGGGSRRRHE